MNHLYFQNNCSTCIHENVCKYKKIIENAEYEIKPKIYETLFNKTLSVDTPAPAITVNTSISCSEFNIKDLNTLFHSYKISKLEMEKGK